jgi:hypothetical protein
MRRVKLTLLKIHKENKVSKQLSEQLAADDNAGAFQEQFDTSLPVAINKN